ncbi:DUF5655 domain-containing protein [Rheinheimera oceanensis]|uniref:DUF5655 domain-containing protein n=1 Tax=Rheinheimera oceanensis TaxID=2817449 RepID=UPI0032E8E26C
MFRSRRIFVDLSIMQDSVRVAIHLSRRIDNLIFIKIVADGKQVTHIAKITNLAELKHIEPLIKEAWAVFTRLTAPFNRCY